MSLRCRLELGAMLIVLASHPMTAGATDGGAAIKGCIDAAADTHHVPPAVLVILLDVEGGSLGAVSANINGTVDIGPMQVNQIWLTQVASHWRTDVHSAYLALRDSFCANVEAGAWILRQALDEAHGDFWEGVGIYHSHDAGYKAAYLRSVWEHLIRLQSRYGHPSDRGRQSPSAGLTVAARQH